MKGAQGFTAEVFKAEEGEGVDVERDEYVSFSSLLSSPPYSTF